MFTVIGTEAKRLGRSSWTEILSVFLVAGIFTLAVALFVATVAGIFPPKGNARPTTITAPAVKTAPAPVLVPVQAPVVPISEPTAKWPQTEVQWGKAFYHEPGSPTVPYSREQNFYYGGMPSSPTPEQNEFCSKLVPWIGKIDSRGISCSVAAARDATDKSIILASLHVTDSRTAPKEPINYMPFLFLSLDNGETWQEINLPDLELPIAGIPAVAVEKRGTTVYLFARDNTVAPMIFPAEIELSQ